MIRHAFRLAFLFTAVLVAACATKNWNQVAQSWQGQPITVLAATWGPPDRVWERSDGLTAYRYDLAEIAPDCRHTWLVDAHGQVTNWYYEGGCKPVEWLY